MLIFLEIKIFIFENFSHVFLKTFSKSSLAPYPLQIEVKIFFNEQAVTSSTKDMYHTPLSQF